jgi:hypothetical protein
MNKETALYDAIYDVKDINDLDAVESALKLNPDIDNIKFVLGGTYYRGPDNIEYSKRTFGPIGYVLYHKSIKLQYKILLLFIKYGIDMTNETITNFDTYYSEYYDTTYDLRHTIKYDGHFSDSHRNFILYLLNFSAKQYGRNAIASD